jgi:GDPmannose 4,6-dehydratase
MTDHVSIGNLDSKRDWGHSRDYVRAMWMMVQQDEPDDYVVATGETHSIRELCELAFTHVDLKWEDYVRIDERFLRPAEVDLLIGDAAKAKEQLGWKSEVSFEGLIREMVDSDIELFSGNPRA